MKNNYNFISLGQGDRRFYFDQEYMNIDNICIEDIAYSLSKVCRFAGHCSRFYSVAEHSILVSRILPPHLAMSGLLHDATEAFLGDVTRPLKEMLPNYKEIENKLANLIEQKFEISFDDPLIKRADNIALFLEAKLLFPYTDLEEWGIELFGDDILAQYQCLLGENEILPFQAGKQFIRRDLEIRGLYD